MERGETFEEAAERVHLQRLDDGVKSARDEITRLRSYAFEIIGPIEAKALKTTDINGALDNFKAAGKSKQTTQHLKQDIANVLGTLVREGELSSNPADGAELPRFPDALKKERAAHRRSALTAMGGVRHVERRRV